MNWVWRMVRRDLRTQWLKFLSFSAAVVMGVGALVATEGFSLTVKQAMVDQSKTLLGADLLISSNNPIDLNEPFLADLPPEQSLTISFASMARFESTGETRLARVRAIEGGFPYYGSLETRPAQAVSALQVRSPWPWWTKD